MDKERITKKIKKLMALAKSTNPNEAAIAMQQALKLMKLHGVNEADIELSQINEFKSKNAPSDANKPPRYMNALASVVMKAFGVSGYYSYNRETCKKCVTFIGIDNRPQLAAYAFEVLTRQLVKARKEFSASQNKRLKKSTKIARADLFCEGWVNAVYSLLEHFAMTDKEKNLLKQYEEQQLDLTTATVRDAKGCNGGDNAKYAGYLAGKNAELNHGVNGAKNTPLAIGGCRG